MWFLKVNRGTYKSFVSPIISFLESGALNCSSSPMRVSRETAVKGTLTMPSPPWSSLYMATMGDPMLRFQITSPDFRSRVTSLPVELSAKWATSERAISHQHRGFVVGTVHQDNISLYYGNIVASSAFKPSSVHDGLEKVNDRPLQKR